MALKPGKFGHPQLEKSQHPWDLRLAKVVESWLPQQLSTRDVWRYLNLLDVQRGAHAPYLSQV
jgi:hypothetical protein